MPPRFQPAQPLDPNPKFRIRTLASGWSEWWPTEMALEIIGSTADIKAVEIRETMTKDQYLAYLRKFAI